MHFNILFTFVLLVLKTYSNPTAGYEFDPNPTGSTGCSSRWRNPHCWRFCEGSQGSWCYTSRGCGRNTESCALLTTCEDIGCEGASPGCVSSCATNKSLTFMTARSFLLDKDVKEQRDPIGSTGCSKKWTIFRSWCWRFCSGTSGSWCYTDTNCYWDNEVCATKTRCAGVGCKGAEPGCVEQCPDRSSRTLSVSQKRTMQQDEVNCLQFTEIKVLSSEKSRLWYSLECSFDSRNTTRDRVSMAVLIKLSIKIWAPRPLRKITDVLHELQCNQFDYGTAAVLKQQFIKLEEQVGRGLGEINMERPRNSEPGNPVVIFCRRRIKTNPEVFRVEYLTAVFHRRHLSMNNKTEFRGNVSNWMRTYLKARKEDVDFYLAPRRLGGPSALYNIVPGHPSVNISLNVPIEMRMNDWQSVENMIVKFLQQGEGRYVEWSVGLYYETLLGGRPTHFAYMAEFWNSGPLIHLRVLGALKNQPL